MGALQKLAGQTAIYGLSSILGRLVLFLFVPLYTRVLDPAEYAVSVELYAWAGFLAVLLTYGFETAFFRFVKSESEPEKVFGTALTSLSFSSIVFLIPVLLLSPLIATAMQFEGQVSFIRMFALILAMDAMAAIPFARLRQQERALRFAGVRLAEIGLTILLNLIFYVGCPWMLANGVGSGLISWYDPSFGVGYMFVANLMASALKLLLLLGLFREVRLGIDKALWSRMWKYAYPLIFIGLAGMVNELFDRAMLKYLLPGTTEENMTQLGIYGSVYKLSVFMSLFNQAFRYAAEPFFFNHADDKGSRKLYADVLKYFFVFGCMALMGLIFFIDLVKHFIGSDFREGLHVLPILLAANLALGVYINLSIWYKLTDKTMLGALVSMAGAAITIGANLLLIPLLGYAGAAWATLICYSFMVIASFILGRTHYPVPYEYGRLIIYGLATAALCVIPMRVLVEGSAGLQNYLYGVFGLAAFAGLVWVLERKQLMSYFRKQS